MSDQVGTTAPQDVVAGDGWLPFRMYYGSEFVSGLLDQWAYSNAVKIEFSRLGKPTDNAVIESFNGRFREECLNTHWFESLDDARAKIDAWRWTTMSIVLTDLSRA